jgi:uncharacterized protein YceK
MLKLKRPIADNVNIILVLLACVVLTGCSSLVQTTPKNQCLNSLAEISDFCELVAQSGTSVACNMPITIPPGLTAVPNQKQLSEAFGVQGEGAICCGVIVSVTKAVIVYRAWTDLNKQYGKWWSPTPLPKSKDEYRRQDDICYGWDPTLANVSECELKVGTVVAIGPGQSACCSDGNFYPESNVIQMYVPDAESSVSNCSTRPWLSD